MKFIWLKLITLAIYIFHCDSGLRLSGSHQRKIVTIYPACHPTENCVDIRSCPTFVELLHTQGHNLQTTDELQKKRCGVGKEPVKVCCPPPSTLENFNQLDLAECGKSIKIERTVIGQNTSLGEWPWVVAMGSQSIRQSSPSFHCAGALISNQWVISAAHCIESINGSLSKFVRLGDLDLNDHGEDGATPIDISIDQIIFHPQYSSNPVPNNLALIRLKTPVHFTRNIRPICLPKESESRKNEYYIKRFPIVLGWEIKNGQNNSSRLQETQDNLIEWEKCAEKYIKNGITFINERVLCTKKLEKDLCQLDPGALLILPNSIDFRMYLEGIISSGFHCSSENPKVYTKIAQFVKWIRETIEKSYFRN